MRKYKKIWYMTKNVGAEVISKCMGYYTKNMVINFKYKIALMVVMNILQT